MLRMRTTFSVDIHVVLKRQIGLPVIIRVNEHKQCILDPDKSSAASLLEKIASNGGDSDLELSDTEGAVDGN